MCTGLQLEFYITRCWCHLRVKRTGATSRAGTTHPSRALDPPPPVLSGVLFMFYKCFY